MRTAHRAQRALIMAALVSVAAMGGAQASLVRWDLRDVTFDDGSIASGFFLFDADNLEVPPPETAYSPQLINWDIVVTESPSPCQPCFPLLRFTRNNTSHTSAGPTSLYLEGPSFYDPHGRNRLVLQLGFDSPISDAGGIVALAFGEEAFIYEGHVRSIVSGNIQGSISEATELLFLLVGLAALGTSRYLKMSPGMCMRCSRTSA